MENLRLVSEEYFRSLNSIAKRICDDISSTRENYESAWDYLSAEEQNQVINESLIYPDAVLRYSMEDEASKLTESFPTLKIAYGCKILQDDSGIEWRDEHSAPFSWKTSSQLLNASHSKDPNLAKEEKQILKKKKPPVPPPKPPKSMIILNTDIKVCEKNNQINDMLNDSSSHSQQENSTLSEDDYSSFNSQNVLPKTGCEFLDNW